MLSSARDYFFSSELGVSLNAMEDVLIGLVVMYLGTGFGNYEVWLLTIFSISRDIRPKPSVIR